MSEDRAEGEGRRPLVGIQTTAGPHWIPRDMVGDASPNFPAMPITAGDVVREPGESSTWRVVSVAKHGQLSLSGPDICRWMAYCWPEGVELVHRSKQADREANGGDRV